MYISRLALNVRRPETIRLLSSPYRMHAAIENAFPPDACRASDEGRILWRIDSSRCESRPSRLLAHCRAMRVARNKRWRDKGLLACA